MGEFKIDKLVDSFCLQAKHITKKMTVKANETVECTKLKFAIGEAEEKIAECKKKIGDMIYREYLKTKDFEGELAELCKMIDNLNDDVLVMKDKLAEVKSSRRCPKCGKLNDDRNTFCADCGTKLNGEGEESNE